MAVCKRVLTCTNVDNNSGDRTVPLSSFKVTGDQTKIHKILSISFEHYHTSTREPKWSLKGHLVVNGEPINVDSDVVQKQFKGGIVKYVNTWTALPSAATFNSLTAVQTLANVRGEWIHTKAETSSGTLYWRATQRHPMRLTITYEDTPPTNYGPSIKKFQVMRVNEANEPADDGNRLRVTAWLGLRVDLASVPVVPSLRMHITSAGEATPGSASHDLSGSISSMLKGQTSVFLKNTPRPQQNRYSCLLRFVVGEEVAEVRFTVPRSFATLHLSAASTGGIAIGGYSSSTEGHPLTESYHPVLLRGGFEPNEDTAPTLASGISTPGKYGRALRFRRVGQIVYASGTVKCASAVESTDICTIPTSMCPSTNTYLLVPVTGFRVGRICIYKDGRVHLDAVHQFGSSHLVNEAFGWIGMDFSYWAD